MTQLQVNIPDNQLQFFENLINKLGYDYKPLKEVDWYDELTKEQKEDIEIGLKELDEGKGIPHAQVQKEIDELFGRI